MFVAFAFDLGQVQHTAKTTRRTAARSRTAKASSARQRWLARQRRLASPKSGENPFVPLHTARRHTPYPLRHRARSPSLSARRRSLPCSPSLRPRPPAPRLAPPPSLAQRTLGSSASAPWSSGARPEVERPAAPPRPLLRPAGRPLLRPAQPRPGARPHRAVVSPDGQAGVSSAPC